jgi:hypothetical protein
MMKRYRLGLDCSHHLSLLAYKTTQRRSMEFFPYQCIAEARIIAESLFVRVQKVYLIPFGRALESIGSCYIHICPHTGRLGQLPENGHSGLRQCNYCPTEYQIDIQDYGQLGVVVVITKWLDLGEGRTIMDPKWWNHLSKLYANHDVFARAGWVYKKIPRDGEPVLFEAGPIYALFEAGSIYALFERNDEHLTFDPLPTLEVKKLFEFQSLFTAARVV